MKQMKHEIRLDQTKRLGAQAAKGHNRWHPAIPPVLKLEPGDEALIDTLDALDCQIGLGGVADASAWDLNAAHPLTGPVWINGAETGDLLEVQLIDIIASGSGWTAQLPGFGFLRDLFPEPHLVRWRLNSGYAESPDLPGVRIPEASFPGVIGIAPSMAQLERIIVRERATAERGGAVMPPEPRGAIPAVEPI